MATQNTVGPSDGNGPSLGNVDFEGLGLEKEMVKGLKSAYDYVEKILKVMEKVEKSSGKVGKNISGKGGNSQNIGLGEIRTGFSSMGAGQRAFTVGMGAAAVGQIAMSMAPNTMAAVNQRMSADTVAGISGMSANALIGQANRAVGGGVTGMGSPTAAAMGIMYGGGYTASSLSSKNIMSQVGGLSAISGGSNQQVAAALASANGMNFLRAGISIRDGKGQLKPPNQMINDAYNFLYRGKKITADQAAMVYNPGSKGYYTLSQLAGGNQDLMGVLQAGVVARARSGGGALSGDTLGSAQKSLDLMGVGKDSPIRSLFNFNTSQNKVLQNTQQGLVGGYNAGLNTATGLNNAFADVASAAQGVTNALMGLKGFLQTFPQAGNVAGTVSGVTSMLGGMGVNALGTKFALESAGVVGKTGEVANVVGKGAKAAKAAAAAAEAARLAKVARFARLAKIGGPLAFLASGVQGYASRKASGGGINWGSIFSSGAQGAAISGAAGALFGGIGAVPAAIGGGLLSAGGNLLGQLFGGGGQGGPSDSTGNTTGSQGFHQLHSPVPSGARINAGYGMRTYKGANGKMITGMHHGVDYGIVENTPLYAVDSGTVLKTSKDPKGYGNYTVLQHPDGRQSLYGHLNKFVANPGKKVAAGDVIGLSGGRAGAAGAGNSTGPHLHFEYGASVGAGNGQMNPQPLFKKGGWLSGLFNAVKGFLGMGPSPRGTTYGTESNINLNKGTNNLSSGDLSSLIGSITHGGNPISYEDITKRLGPTVAKKVAAQNIDYSKISGGGQVGHKDLMTLLYRKGFKGKSLDTAFAVSLAESGGRAGALGDVGLQTAKWGPSIGLFQIRSLKHWNNYDGKGSKDPWRDGHRLPQTGFNAEAAIHKSTNGTNWSPWATFTSGKFTKFLADAAATKAALKIPGRYAGGNVKGSSPYVVGEGGPEVFVPDVGGTIIPNSKAKSMGIGMGGKSVNIHVKMDVNIAQASPAEADRMVHIFADSLERKLKLHQIGVY
jgi:hypothetical protein